MNHLIADILEEAPHLNIGDGGVGGDDPQLLDAAIGLQRGVHGRGAQNDRKAPCPGHHLGGKAFGAGRPIPEGFRRHAHDHTAGIHGEGDVDGPQGVVADIVQHHHEGLVVRHLGVGNGNAAEVIGDAHGAHIGEFRFHAGIGGGRDHREFHPPAE